MSNSCPCCGRKYLAPRQSSDKKLTDDRQRAQAAIDLLERFNPAIPSWAQQPMARKDGAQFNPSLMESIESELSRMRLALNNQALLWSIYRRKDKASGYTVQPAMPKMAERERQMAVA